MSSGVKVDSECIDAFSTLKLYKNKPEALAFVIFGFNEDNTKIIVLHKEPALKYSADDSFLDKNSQWEKMIEMLPEGDVRYAVADIHFNSDDGPRTEIVFISWAPSTTSVKKRILVASSKEALKETLTGVKTNIQATSYPDLDLRSVVHDLRGYLD